MVERKLFLPQDIGCHKYCATMPSLTYNVICVTIVLLTPPIDQRLQLAVSSVKGRLAGNVLL